MNESPVPVSDYDKFAYPSAIYPQTHPDCLALVATLHGLQPARIERARVLELGCGDGNNLISMAFTLPEGTFHGVDLALEPIRRGNEVIAALGLKHVSLRQMDVMQMPADIGQFDYIIAHGLYSWVPEMVREKILAICRDHLTENGVAFISYNAYPGCHMRDVARGITRFHARQFSEPVDQVQQGRALLKYLAESHSQPRIWQNVLMDQFKRLEKRSDAGFFHDDLGPFNQPFYFYEFAEAAARYQLEFVAEADVRSMPPGGLTDEGVRVLGQMERMNRVAFEQYVDFVVGRPFRRTLLCRQGRSVDREMRSERLANLFVAGDVAAVNPGANMAGPGSEDFKRGETVIATDKPLLKSALKFLGEAWPRRVSFAELLGNGRAEVPLCPNKDNDGRAEVPLCPNPQTSAVPGPTSDLTPREGTQGQGTSESNLGKAAALPYHRDLAQFLLQCFTIGFVDLHAFPGTFVAEVSEHPAASPMVRLQVRQGPGISSLRHQPLKIADAFGRDLLMLLDGTRDRAALLRDMGERVKTGSIPIYRDGKHVEDVQQALEVLESQLDPCLASLVKLGLFVG